MEMILTYRKIMANNLRRQTVDDLVKEILHGKETAEDLVIKLMRSHRNLDNHANAEREVLKEVVAANIILAKVVRELASNYSKMYAKLNSLEQKLTYSASSFCSSEFNSLV